MTTEAELLEKQANRIARINEVRRAARKVACPTCKVEANQFCLNKKGQPRISSHEARNGAALEQGLLMRVRGILKPCD